MRNVIVLAANGAYWGEDSLKKAVKKCELGKAMVMVHDEDKYIRSYRKKIQSPLIIMLRSFTPPKEKHRKVPYSDAQVFARDRNYCQYWHYYKFINGIYVPLDKPVRYRCTDNDRTIDHVMPLSRGGRRSDFTNAVTACRYCNEIIKKNRTPEEVGLKLINQPVIPERKVGEPMAKIFLFSPSKKSHRAYVKWARIRGYYDESNQL